MKKIEFTLEETRKIITLYLEESYGFRKIGELFNISRSAVERLLKENNIQPTQCGQKYRGGKKAADARYKETHRDFVLKKTREWHKEHREDRRKYHTEWRNQNREHVREWARNAEKRRYQTNPTYRLTKNIRYGVWACLKEREADKVLRTFQILPYTVKQLKVHLESQFQPNMTWENYGEWHIDHRVPISSFNFTSHKDPEFQQCWALDNLQPLWGGENWSKGSKT